MERERERKRERERERENETERDMEREREGERKRETWRERDEIYRHYAVHISDGESALKKRDHRHASQPVEDEGER